MSPFSSLLELDDRFDTATGRLSSSDGIEKNDRRLLALMPPAMRGVYTVSVVPYTVASSSSCSGSPTRSERMFQLSSSGSRERDTERDIEVGHRPRALDRLDSRSERLEDEGLGR